MRKRDHSREYLLEPDDDKDRDEEEIYKATSTETKMEGTPVPEPTKGPTGPRQSTMEANTYGNITDHRR
jgi:hypothetical protein